MGLLHAWLAGGMCVHACMRPHRTRGCFSRAAVPPTAVCTCVLCIHTRPQVTPSCSLAHAHQSRTIPARPAMRAPALAVMHSSTSGTFVCLPWAQPHRGRPLGRTDGLSPLRHLKIPPIEKVDVASLTMTSHVLPHTCVRDLPTQVGRTGSGRRCGFLAPTARVKGRGFVRKSRCLPHMQVDLLVRTDSGKSSVLLELSSC